MSDEAFSSGDLNTFRYLHTFNVEVKFVRTMGSARLPTKAYEYDNCWDIYAASGAVIPSGGSAVVPVGLTVAYISKGYGLAIKPRSGIGFKNGIQPHLGEIDFGYRGDLSIKLYNFSNHMPTDISGGDSPHYHHTIPSPLGEDYVVSAGDRIAQFKVERVYRTKVSFVNNTLPGDRGDKGFGSSGK